VCGVRLRGFPFGLRMRQKRRRGKARLWIAGLAVLGIANLLGCGTLAKPASPIRTIVEIKKLPEREIAGGRPVELRGLITLFDPGWRLLAVQDETGGILVDWPPLATNVQIGDQVEVAGATSIDNHVPSIVAASIHVVGKAPLPRPEVTSADSIACGKILNRMVEVEFRPDEGSFGDGTHTARFTSRQRCNQLVVIGRLLRRYSPASLTGRRLRVRGVPLAFYSPSGAIDHVRLMFEDDSNLDVLDTPPPEVSPAFSSTLPELRSIKAVKALPRAEAARGYPALVEGVVTAPVNPRHDGYFIQEGSTGICIFAPRNQGTLLRAGQRIRVQGRTEKGGFAAVIRQSSLEILGHAPLPKPVKIDPGDVFHGWEENLWVEVEGLATAVITDGQTHQLELFVGPKRLLVWFSEEDSPEILPSMIGSRLLVRGVYSPLYSASGALLGFRMFTPSGRMLKVIERPAAEEEVRTIASLSQFDPRGAPRHRFRTAGTVTYRDTRGRLYLQEGNSSLQVVGNGAGDPPLNTWATVEGFLSPEMGMPRIEHVRWVNANPSASPAPTPALAESLVSGELEGRLVTVEGFLESRRTSGGELQLDVIAARTRFTAYMEAPGSQDAFQNLRPGALLRLTGVCATQPAQSIAGGFLASLWLRGANDVEVVRGAPWWDLRRALYAAFTASALLILVLAWVARLRHNLVVQMALRSKLEEQLLHAQKLESVGRLAGGVAHDFNNYLTVVLGYTSLLLEQFPDQGTIHKQLSTIREVGETTASLTRQLLAFSRKQVMQPVPCNLNDIIADAKATLLPLIGEHIDIVMHLQELGPVSIDPAQFLQVLVNLAVNARDAMPNGGKLTFETTTREFAARNVPPEYGLQPGQYVCVSIMDTGVGMDRRTRQRIFEPFFTTKEAGRGTGLGLAVVFGIVKQSNGHIEVESKPGEGTCFRIYLPIAKMKIPSKQPRIPRKERAGSETILLVEDQTAVRELVCTALEAHGYKVIAADSPKQALSTIEDPAVSIDLLLTDLVMPEMSGRLLAAQAAVKQPGIRILYITGYSEEVIAEQDAGGERIDCLEKPFTPSEVAAAVRRTLDKLMV
jgi:signal transduction histidine kinase/ActR/RegA family two-component response regulator